MFDHSKVLIKALSSPWALFSARTFCQVLWDPGEVAVPNRSFQILHSSRSWGPEKTLYRQNVPSNVNLGIWWGKWLVTTSNCRRVNQVCLTQHPRVAFLSTKHDSDASKREPSTDFVYTLFWQNSLRSLSFINTKYIWPTTFSWCNDTIAREKCCLYPPADLPLGKTFFSTERRESNSFHYRNHATHRIRDWIPRNEFLAVFASYPLQ